MAKGEQGRTLVIIDALVVHGRGDLPAVGRGRGRASFGFEGGDVDRGFWRLGGVL